MAIAAQKYGKIAYAMRYSQSLHNLHSPYTSHDVHGNIGLTSESVK